MGGAVAQYNLPGFEKMQKGWHAGIGKLTDKDGGVEARVSAVGVGYRSALLQEVWKGFGDWDGMRYRHDPVRWGLTNLNNDLIVCVLIEVCIWGKIQTAEGTFGAMVQ